MSIPIRASGSMQLRRYSAAPGSPVHSECHPARALPPAPRPARCSAWRTARAREPELVARAPVQREEREAVPGGPVAEAGPLGSGPAVHVSSPPATSSRGYRHRRGDAGQRRHLPGAPWHHWVRIGPDAAGAAVQRLAGQRLPVGEVAVDHRGSTVDVRTASRSSSAVRSGPSSRGRPARAATLPANPCAGLMYCATVP